MFKHKHYVPILKTKLGERTAVRDLAAADKPHITPMFELHQHTSLSDIDHARAMAREIANCWGTSQPCYLDVSYAPGAPVLLAFLDEARQVGLKGVPAVGMSSDLPTLAAAQQIHAADQRGVLLRVKADELRSGPASITSVASFLSIPTSQVDLLLDYGTHAMQLLTDVPLIPSLPAWRALISSSGTFPKTLSNLPLHTWNVIPRYCWQTWIADVTGATLARKPTFSDYGTRSPGRPPSGGEPSVNLRYAADVDWKVRTGGKVKDGASTDMFTICQNLITQPFFSGPNFSQGDVMFNSLATGTAGPGNTANWVQWSLNHHMTFVSKQIQSHPGL